MRHGDLIVGQSQALGLPAAGFQLPPQQLLHLANILLQLLLMRWIVVSGIQECPSEEVLDVLPPDLRRRRIQEPFREISLRVGDVVMTALE
jgi:hypothetical protein